MRHPSATGRDFNASGSIDNVQLIRFMDEGGYQFLRPLGWNPRRAGIAARLTPVRDDFSISLTQGLAATGAAEFPQA